MLPNVDGIQGLCLTIACGLIKSPQSWSVRAPGSVGTWPMSWPSCDTKKNRIKTYKTILFEQDPTQTSQEYGVYDLLFWNVLTNSWFRFINMKIMKIDWYVKHMNIIDTTYINMYIYIYTMHCNILNNASTTVLVSFWENILPRRVVPSSVSPGLAIRIQVWVLDGKRLQQFLHATRFAFPLDMRRTLKFIPVHVSGLRMRKKYQRLPSPLRELVAVHILLVCPNPGNAYNKTQKMVQLTWFSTSAFECWEGFRIEDNCDLRPSKYIKHCQSSPGIGGSSYASCVSKSWKCKGSIHVLCKIGAYKRIPRAMKVTVITTNKKRIRCEFGLVGKKRHHTSHNLDEKPVTSPLYLQDIHRRRNRMLRGRVVY